MSTSIPDPRRWWVLAAVMLAFTPVVLDMTILHVAVPSMTQALGASNTQVLWVIDIYPLLMAGLLVPMGTLADRIGNRRLLLLGLSIFGTASAIAALAPRAEVLIGARVLLALGGSMILPCVLGILRRTFERDDERAMALGLWGTVGAAGAAVGPLVGGALLDRFWWGSVFLINLPVMALVIPACWSLIPKDEGSNAAAWPIGQALLLICGMILLVYAVKAGFAGKHPAWAVLLILAVGAGLVAVFARQQLKSSNPMLDLSLFSRPAILAGMLMAVVATSALAGVELTLAQELQYVIGKSPLEAGLFMLPIMLASAVGGPVAGRLSTLLGLRALATGALALGALALLALAQADFAHPGRQVPALLALLGLSLSISLTASSIAIMNSVEADKGAAAGSLEGTSYEMGAGIGITVFGVFLSSVYGSRFLSPPGLDAALVEAAAQSIGDTYLVAAKLAAPEAGALIAAGKAAFTAAHGILLTTAGSMIGLLALLVCLLLARYDGKSSGAH